MYWPLNVPSIYAAKVPFVPDYLDDLSSTPIVASLTPAITPNVTAPSTAGDEDEEGKKTGEALLIDPEPDDFGEPYVGDHPSLLEDVAEEESGDAAVEGNGGINGPSSKNGGTGYGNTGRKGSVQGEGQVNPAAKDVDAEEGSASNTPVNDKPTIAVKVARNGILFATITEGQLSIWQVHPTAVVACVVRSPKSMLTYGPNTDLMIRPDSQVFVVQTANGYFITYFLQSDFSSQSYKPVFPHKTSNLQNAHIPGGFSLGAGEGGGVHHFQLKFRMVIKVDAGISRALAWDDELVVATLKPAAIQCIRWDPSSGAASQTSTELLSRMPWMVNRKVTVKEMTHDRPMNLSTWITSDGRAYAVQKLGFTETEATGRLFKGYCFHTPANEDDAAVKVTINARFSLLAVATARGNIRVYNARDYVGNIPLSHVVQAPHSGSSFGGVTFLAWSPDGYALFGGFEMGWAMWSVYGKPCGSTSRGNSALEKRETEVYLDGLNDGAWLPGGGEIVLVGCTTPVDDQERPGSEKIWILKTVRSTVVGLFSPANIARTVLQSSTELLLYKGHETPAVHALSIESTLWQHIPFPTYYLAEQHPIRHVVISPDGRYIAVAGRRGLAHYSVSSGRWKTFTNEVMENDFFVRGGMCWYHHILIAAVECDEVYELRLYSRELQLDNSLLLHIETLPSPVVLLTLTGDDGILVYTHENILYHFIIQSTKETVQLKLVGQITLHGIVRAPARVRAISWILPDDQLRDGDPSQDVAMATVLFLVDGKLVLLQPSTTEGGELKYDMRVLLQNVEFYVLMRDIPAVHKIPKVSSTSAIESLGIAPQSLNDSLWVFDGQDIQVWMDLQNILQSEAKEAAGSVKVPIDFYPLSILLSKGIVSGVEVDIVQRRDVGFSYFRLGSRTHLFFQHLLRYHLSNRDERSALALARLYEDVTYFEHALEVLLHDVLDDEADNPPDTEDAILPLVVRFLSNFPEYLNVVVQCTRKTEVASWAHLFSVVGSPQVLFEESLSRGLLKTAGGYLLILHTMEKLSSSSQDMVRLFSRAVAEEDWDLCKELARFLTALDNSGKTLKEALELVDLRSPVVDGDRSFMFESARLTVPGSGGRTESPTSLDGSDGITHYFE